MIQILRKLNIATSDIFILFLISFVSYIIYLTIKYSDRAVGTISRKDLVGPKGIPIFGNFFSVIRRKTYIQFEHELANKYGQLFTFTIFKLGRVIVSNDPRTIEHVLKTRFDDFGKDEVIHEMGYEMFGDGIFAVNGYKWKFQRRIISHLFLGKNFKNLIYTSVIGKSKIVINILKKYADSGKPIDLQDLFYKFTMDTFGDMSFGVDFGCLTHPEEKSQFVINFDYAQDVIFGRFTQPFWKLVEKYSENGRRMRKACKYIDDYVYNMINNHKSELEVEKKTVNNLLTLLINAVDDNGKTFNDKELRDVILNLILAGRDTTAQALSWMMYLIMANKSVEDLLLQEINTLLSVETSIPSYDDIKLFKYATATFYETLRLYPIVPVNGRACIKDTVLPNNVPIFAGEFVEYNLFIMGRDEKIWGDDAKQFNPQRFLDSDDGLKPNKFKFAAFHAGPRTCLGQQFATLEVITLVVMMLKEFKFELVPGQKSPPEFKDAITLPMKDPLMTKVSYRTKN
ncbi:cytochrome P450 [Gigaspora rosea]|uniref:Cytochrome P450 n=1 Tax=Gigaspora rosea TaxID=44941 RepID=A0A397U000_9GLOM|nr:cytochrome P450 [Gigaspora rosea]